MCVYAVTVISAGKCDTAGTNIFYGSGPMPASSERAESDYYYTQPTKSRPQHQLRGRQLMLK